MHILGCICLSNSENRALANLLSTTVNLLSASSPGKRHKAPVNAVFVLNDANYARDRRQICVQQSYVAPSPCRRDAKKKTDGNFSRIDLINCHKRLCYSVGEKLQNAPRLRIFIHNSPICRINFSRNVMAMSISDFLTSDRPEPAKSIRFSKT